MRKNPDQFDMFGYPEPVASPPPILHTLEIREAHIGDPVRKSGYVAKYGGAIVHALISAGAFARYTEIEKLGMQNRLRVHILSGK